MVLDLLTMELTEKSSEVWHLCLSSLPEFSSVILEEFIDSNKATKVKSDRGYKFFLEGYVHQFEGRLNLLTC